jgi:hypothetical protein
MTVFILMRALTSVNDGSGRMVPAGETFDTSERRAADLVVHGFADVLLPKDQEAVLALAEADADLQALIEARTERLVRDAWANGMRPDAATSRR